VHKSIQGFVVVFIMIALLTTLLPLQVGYAASLPDIVNALGSDKAVAALDSGSSGGALSKLLEFLFDKILGPILNLGDGLSGGGARSGNLSGKTIVLDPGHGGGNPGAVGPGGVYESNVNLAVGLKLKKLLENSGANVVMTRSTDRYVAAPGSSLGQELQARLDIADGNNADVFISLHSNSNENGSIQGAMTFYHADTAKPLADNIQQHLIKTTGAVNKGVEPATFYVLRNASMPSVLIEMGFVTNPAEEQKLNSSSYQDKLAQGIYQGIVAYFAK
jgi:N-acetylmuramoyl-L-alanine amidase